MARWKFENTERCCGTYLYRKNRGDWDLSNEKIGEVAMTNGIHGYGWNLKYRVDGNLKIYGHGLQFIGFKQFDPVLVNYTPPPGVKEITLKEPAFIEGGQLYIHLGAIRYLGSSMSEFANQVYIYRGKDSFAANLDENNIWRTANTKSSAKVKDINGTWYVPAQELLSFLQMPYTLAANNQILLIDNEYYAKIVPMPSE